MEHDVRVVWLAAALPEDAAVVNACLHIMTTVGLDVYGGEVRKLSDVLAHADNTVVFAAADVPLGFAIVHHDVYAPHAGHGEDAAETLWIDRFEVFAEHRGKGVGRACIAALRAALPHVGAVVPRAVWPRTMAFWWRVLPADNWRTLLTPRVGETVDTALAARLELFEWQFCVRARPEIATFLRDFMRAPHIDDYRKLASWHACQ